VIRWVAIICDGEYLHRVAHEAVVDAHDSFLGDDWLPGDGAPSTLPATLKGETQKTRGAAKLGVSKTWICVHVCCSDAFWVYRVISPPAAWRRRRRTTLCLPMSFCEPIFCYWGGHKHSDHLPVVVNICSKVVSLIGELSLNRQLSQIRYDHFNFLSGWWCLCLMMRLPSITWAIVSWHGSLELMSVSSDAVTSECGIASCTYLWCRNVKHQYSISTLDIKFDIFIGSDGTAFRLHVTDKFVEVT